jgi:hypothetical protein
MKTLPQALTCPLTPEGAPEDGDGTGFGPHCLSTEEGLEVQVLKHALATQRSDCATAP